MILDVDNDLTHHKDKLRALPSVDKLLQECGDAVQQYGHQAVTTALRAVLDDRRKAIVSGETPSIDAGSVKLAAQQALENQETPPLQRVFNLTGTILHTNLGRAILPREAVEAITAAASDYSNLEFDLESGRRGNRENFVEDLVCELTGAEAATLVNNNAAAVLLTLNTLAMNREVPVSRGELVEIGGSFRIPEVMQRANCTLIEVGSTNRTHLKDYEAAINERTALLMKVHTSNYKIEGFTSEVSEADLAGFASETGLPFVMDLGSGSLLDLSRYGLPAEPTVGQIISLGTDIVTFSGDKLLGGPQGGIIAGKADLINQIKTNPLKRALRLDKMTLAGLAAVLKLYRNPESILDTLPTLKHMTRSLGDIRRQAQRLAEALAKTLGDRYHVDVIDAKSQVGSGSLPTSTIPSFAVAISSQNDGEDVAHRLAEAFRKLPVPVVGHVHKASMLLDVRCLDDEDGLVTQLDQLEAAP